MLEQQKCPICDNFSNHVNSLYLLGLIECGTYCCNSCGTYFRYPLPDEKAIIQYYRSHYFRYPDDVERAMAETQGKWLVDRLQHEGIGLDSVNYIEFGAGRGWLISYLQRQGIASTIGYEPDSTSVKWGKDNFHVDLREGFLEDAMPSRDINTSENTVVALVHVLEHLHCPFDALTMLRTYDRSLYVFIEIPDATWEGPVMAGDSFAASSMGQHFWSFPELGIETLLDKAGYLVVSREKLGNPHFWDHRLATLSTWQFITQLYQDWSDNGLELKKCAIASLRVASMCASIMAKARWRRIRGQTYSRLDLPVIRILAKAVP